MHLNPVKLKQVSNFQQVLQILKHSQVPQQMKVSQVQIQNFSVYTPETPNSNIYFVGRQHSRVVSALDL